MHVFYLFFILIYFLFFCVFSGLGMLCSLCIKHQRRPKKCVPGRATWVDVPCTSFRRASLKNHQDSDNHAEAIIFETGASFTAGGIEAGFVREEEVNRVAMSANMKMLYLLCKEEIPHTTKLQPFVAVVESLGVDILKCLEKGDNAKYTSFRHINDVVKVFGEVIWDNILQDVKSSPFFSVMVDETTDVTTNSQLIIYARYLKDGKSKTSFGGTVTINNGKADTIKDAILHFLSTNDLPLQRMCAFGSDGAAVMVGRKNGVGKQLQDLVPHLLSNHCVAHRLALASAQSAAAVPYLEKFKAILSQLFRFYNYSAVRTASLREIQV